MSERLEYEYMRVATLVSSRIAGETLKPGEALPSERKLATSYSVALGTIRRTIQELRDRGLVVTLPAKGTYVTPDARRIAVFHSAS